MGRAVDVTRRDLSADGLRREAGRISDGRVVRCVLAIAMVFDGMTHDELAAAFTETLGIFGGSDGSGRPSVVFTGAGLRIWGGWHVVNHVAETPLFARKATIAMAKEV